MHIIALLSFLFNWLVVYMNRSMKQKFESFRRWKESFCIFEGDSKKGDKISKSWGGEGDKNRGTKIFWKD